LNTDHDTADLLAPVAPTPAPNVYDLLRKRFAAPEWCLMEEVAPATGGHTRYADAIAVNLWQSRGHAIHGFEVKVSRSDWLRELKQPEKAEPLVRLCDYWSIVAPKGVVKDGELPPTWGLYEPRGESLVQVKAGPKLDAAPLTRAFFASLMRRGDEQLKKIAARMVRNALDESHAEVNRRVDAIVDRRTRDHQELAARVAKFTAETGLEFDRYTGPPVEAIKLAQRLQALANYGTDPLSLSRLTGLAADLERAARTVREAVEATGIPQPKATAGEAA